MRVAATGRRAPIRPRCFNTAAKSFLNAVGASSGPLYATAFMRAGAAVKGKAMLDDGDVVAMLQAMAKGIQDRGKAERRREDHDRRLAARRRSRRCGASCGQRLCGECLAAATRAARAGAEATKAMVATKGRAARLGERSLGHIDPGAASAVAVIEAMRKALSD